MEKMKTNLLQKFCGQWWINLMYALGAIMLVLTIIYGSTWATPRLLAALFVIVLPLHVFEELQFPAGFHYMMNTVQKSEAPNVGPENRLSDMVTNLGAEIIFIGFVVFGGNLATSVAFAIFGIGESIVHTIFGILIWKHFKSNGKRTIYGPGSLSAYFTQLPISIYAIIWLSTQAVATSDIIIGIVIIMLIMGLLIRLPMMILGGKKHPEFAYESAGYFSKFLK